MLNYIITRYKNIFFPDDILSQISLEERRKRFYVVAVTAITIPIFLIFGLVHCFQDGTIENSWVDLLMSLFLFATILVLRKLIDGIVVYRIGMAIFSMNLLYYFTNGLYNGTDILWLYLYPLITFYIFGTVEGAVWIIMMMTPVFVILYFPYLTGAYGYTDEFRIRFVISIITVSFIAGFLESLRLHSYTQLEKKNRALEDALNKVKKLDGLIPICASCKKIRNDKGYWQAVEQYIAQKTDVQFSHGICADCLKKAHPEIYPMVR